MNRFIKKFGEIIGNTLEENPEKVLSLLNTAYAASGFQMRHFPGKDLLPHEKYAAVVCNRVMRKPLREPESSAVVNIFLPCELLQASGISPLFVEGFSGYLNGAGAEKPFIDYSEKSGIPKTYCSYHKTLIGAAISGVLPKPQFVVNTTFICDANNLSFRKLAGYWDVPHFTIDVPSGGGKENLDYLTKQFRELRTFIEDVTGNKIDLEELRGIMRRENRSLRVYRSYFREIAGKFMSNTLTSEMYKLFFTHVLFGTPEAEEYFQMLLQDATEAPAKDKEIRILWMQVLPYWQESIREILNHSGKYQLLCTNMNFDALTDADENDPFESMAKRLLYNTLGGSGEDRINTSIEMARKLNADGAVYFNHWGCKQTIGTSLLAKEMFEDAGIPLLILDGDGCDRNNVNDGQMVTKLQAFLEILEAAK